MCYIIQFNVFIQFVKILFVPNPTHAILKKELIRQKGKIP